MHLRMRSQSHLLRGLTVPPISSIFQTEFLRNFHSNELCHPIREHECVPGAIFIRRCTLSIDPNLHAQRCNLTSYGILEGSRLVNRARNFHSTTSLKQQFSSFQAEQNEENISSATKDLSTSAEDSDLEIANLPISRILVENLATRGITKLFPIQKAVLEPGLKGQDLIARAKTGTGKTLAFGIPILDRIIKHNENLNRRYGRPPLAVVMAPTRELAKQVENELKESAPTLELVCVYGGVSIEGQIRQLQRGVDIAVGTPGRFIDLLERGSLNLREVKYIVLDEADRMLAVGFVEAVQRIFEYLPPLRQSMLFSATMPSWVQDLSRRYLRNPLVVDLVGNKEDKIAEGIKLLSIMTPIAGKPTILADLIKVYGKGCKSIVFTQTKRDADEVAMLLSKTIYCEALHGDITQFQRERTLKAFRDGKINVLIATDVAARGLDISNVELVIHYDIANDSETFVHRSGRTGRAGKEGIAILMHTSYQRRNLLILERELQCKFQSIEPPSAVDVIKSSVEQATGKVQSVRPDVRSIFLPAAEKLLAEEGVGSLAAALAHLCGYTEEMAYRSLLTHGTGLTTLKITRLQGQPILSASDVMRALSRLLPSAVHSLGKVCMLRDEAGAVFDLPASMAKELLALKIETGEVIEALIKLPNVVDEPFGNERSGGSSPFQRGFSGGRTMGGLYGGRPGGFPTRAADGGSWSNRGPSGGDFYNRSQGGSRTDDWSSRPPSGYNRSPGGGNTSDWSRRPPSSYGNNNWSSRPSSNYDSDSSSYGTSNRAFTGRCLKCGQAGHRAIDCPKQ
ncbi:hypothetical protein KP509_17G055300 [Ceratopteris richardii]|uniref:RNA helicase n=1 Tax=Ceratopteris richardii TaxID=49495 RepID=A0A8T2SWD8_CERRI|nr:hypothetical protein KP509_17G055300 [Ceratopteris richardii]